MLLRAVLLAISVLILRVEFRAGAYGLR
jgi:hypothetical protein